MRITVRYFGYLAGLVGRECEQLDMKTASPDLKSLTRRLVEEHGYSFERELLDHKTHRVSYLVLLNKSVVPFSEVHKTEVKDGDEVGFIPPIAGG